VSLGHAHFQSFAALSGVARRAYTRFGVYRRESALIREIFYQFTDLVEPLSLDEAYLDVSHLRSSGAAVAGEIRYRIHQATQLTASAGIAPNKLLAKIASDWKKPDGQFEVTLDAIGGFIWELPVRKLWGVGKKTGDKMTRMGVVSCGDLQRFRPEELVHEFGKFGVELYQQCRGEDHREVKPHRVRKSLGNERTFGENLTTLDACQEKLGPLLDEQADDLRKHGTDRPVAKAYVKVKFHDFTKTSVECVVSGFDPGIYPALLARAWGRGGGKSVRLIGVGVRFAELPQETAGGQLEILF